MSESLRDLARAASWATTLTSLFRGALRVLPRAGVLVRVAALGLFLTLAVWPLVVGISDHTIATTMTAAAVVALLVAWRTWHRASFAWVMTIVRGWVRHRLAYWPRWRGVMRDCGLTKPARDKDRPDRVPQIRRVRSDGMIDTLTVRLLPGQTPDDMVRNADKVLHALGGLNIRIRSPKSGRVKITLVRVDPLATPIPALPIPTVSKADPENVRNAVTEYGDAFRMPLLYTHVLVAGASGSGKGSVLWSTVRGLCPLITAGTARLWGIDPKGGVELTVGAGLFDRLAYDNGDDDAPARLVTLMEEAAALVRQRASRIAGTSRKHTPTVAEPQIVILIDELAFLTAYQPDNDLKKRFTDALSIVLSMGRAVAVDVMAFLQDPRKETIPARSLFPVKIALRLDTPSESRMVLGDAAYDLGAHCEAIPRGTPGVGYALEDGNPEPVRVRFGYPTDDDIRAMQTTYGTGPAATSFGSAAASGELVGVAS